MARLPAGGGPVVAAPAEGSAATAAPPAHSSAASGVVTSMVSGAVCRMHQPQHDATGMMLLSFCLVHSTLSPHTLVHVCVLWFACLPAAVLHVCVCVLLLCR